MPQANGFPGYAPGGQMYPQGGPPGGPHGGLGYPPPHQTAEKPLKRSGSINARIYSADAR